MDEILNALGINYEDLNSDEISTLETWLTDLQSKDVTLNDVRVYVKKMKDNVSLELAKEDEGTKRNIFLKARVMNYIMLEGMLSNYTEAKEALDRYIISLKKK